MGILGPRRHWAEQRGEAGWAKRRRASWAAAREKEGVGAQEKKKGFSILLKWLRGKGKRD